MRQARAQRNRNRARRFECRKRGSRTGETDFRAAARPHGSHFGRGENVGIDRAAFGFERRAAHHRGESNARARVRFGAAVQRCGKRARRRSGFVGSRDVGRVSDLAPSGRHRDFIDARAAHGHRGGTSRARDEKSAQSSAFAGRHRGSARHRPRFAQAEQRLSLRHRRSGKRRARKPAAARGRTGARRRDRQRRNFKLDEMAARTRSAPDYGGVGSSRAGNFPKRSRNRVVASGAFARPRTGNRANVGAFGRQQIDARAAAPFARSWSRRLARCRSFAPCFRFGRNAERRNAERRNEYRVLESRRRFS